MTRISAVIMVVAGLGVVLARSQSSDYLPLSAEEIGARFSLKHIGALDTKPTTLASAAGPGGSSFTVASEHVTLAGLDRQQKRWQVDLFEPDCLRADVYEADLDRDGVTDAILYTPTCGNGLAPPEHLVAVTFDAAGRPVPFEAEGYSGSDERGIEALVDLDRNGQADLIFMSFDAGYWITNIYSADAGRWRRAAGRFANHAFPLYTRFTNSPNTRAVVPPASRHPVAPDLSNTNPQLTGTLADWRWPNPEGAHLDHWALSLSMTIVGSDGKRTACSPDYWYDSARLVVDEPQGRHVFHLSETERTQVDPVLARLVRQRVSLQLFGRRDATRCSPELVWATVSDAEPAAPNQQMEPTRR